MASKRKRPIVAKKPVDKVIYSNVNVVRDTNGKLAVFVGREKMLGATQVQMQPLASGDSLWTFVVPGDRVRLSERVPAEPMYEADNVIPFSKLRAYQEKNKDPA